MNFLFSREYEIYEFKISLFTFANNQRNQDKYPGFSFFAKNLTSDLHGHLANFASDLQIYQNLVSVHTRHCLSLLFAPVHDDLRAVQRNLEEVVQKYGTKILTEVLDM